MILFFIILGAFSAIMTLFYILQEETQKQERFFTVETVRKLFRMLGVFKIKVEKDYFAEEGRDTKEIYRFRFRHPVTIVYVILGFILEVVLNLIFELIPDTVKNVSGLKDWHEWYD